MKLQLIAALFILLTTLLIAQGLRSFVPELLKVQKVERVEVTL